MPQEDTIARTIAGTPTETVTGKPLLPALKTERTRLIPLVVSNAHLIYQYYLDNLEHLYTWDDPASANAFSLETWQTYADWALEQYHENQQIEFIVTDPKQKEMLALCSFNSIRPAPFSSCELGFSIALKHQGKGMMFEALERAIAYLFDSTDIHRIIATYHPDNLRSAALLERLGFEQEGLAKSYKKLGDGREDHMITALIKPTS